MKIAIQGCAHGELEKIYEKIFQEELKRNIKVDLLICCGDFQSTRNMDDLRCMACPIKYQQLCTFYKYYNGEKTAPILTLFIGGNHEASNYLQELPYGGWVAPNIYYLGYAGVVNFCGLRIGGISGIYKGHDYLRGHYEMSPYNEETKRSVYHIRNLEIFRLKQLSGEIDIFLSHDWPRGVYNHGNVNNLLKFKPYFRNDISTNSLGSKPCEELLHHLKPKHWFAAHLHCKFKATITHENSMKTEFLALDKCLPKRQHLEILEIGENENNDTLNLCYDLEWLTIIRLTNHLLSVKKIYNYMPQQSSEERSDFIPTEEEKEKTLELFENNLVIPKNFQKTSISHDPKMYKKDCKQPKPVLNPQTIDFCQKSNIDDPIQLILKNSNEDSSFENTFNITLPGFLTPENKQNITYQSESSNSFLTDSFSSSPFKSSTPMRHLNLPPPKSEIDTSRNSNNTLNSDLKTPPGQCSRSNLNLPTPIRDDSGIKLKTPPECSFSNERFKPYNKQNLLSKFNKSPLSNQNNNDSNMSVDNTEDSLGTSEGFFLDNTSSNQTSNSIMFDANSTVVSDESVNNSSCSISSGKKTFKRRNASFYQ